MLTIESLRELGVNTQEGLARCMNNEAFYLRLVGMGLKDSGFDKLDEAISAGNLDAGFEAAHALKGVLGNLALTPIYGPVSEMTELLRARTQTDYSPFIEKIKSERAKLLALLD